MFVQSHAPILGPASWFSVCGALWKITTATLVLCLLLQMSVVSNECARDHLFLNLDASAQNGLVVFVCLFQVLHFELIFNIFLRAVLVSVLVYGSWKTVDRF